ncbi:uncharacterized protein A1O9_09024 [Exophiala aquamarina CBS 119918]|uniref:Enoyl reductase (ER) domain-containing protein n=1 Tax=Exophiala aquamarina CBS 119918 TaxID=1182545 RepID=A0A072P4E5_9EURO|nr:uncharacterized protein A1O9_09024 [Exophiala aquamarina CBS 119918]KEF54582.1 hypothetical protein A1O9_09024 [Exophiala aquamarina CBS 119918]
MNKCIFVDAKGELSVRDNIAQHQPLGGQALVKVEYSGINPADIAHARLLGFGDNVCGYEFCGTVVAVGPESRYNIGDVVFGSNEPGRGRPQYHGAHQNLVIAESDSMSMRLSKGVPHSDAAALSIMVRTAADALLNRFELPFPAIGFNPSTKSGALVIWGGASTVGSAAIQLAKAMHVRPIFVTASASNHEALKRLGATLCFDYHNANVVEAIVEALKESGAPLRFVFDTICQPGNPGTRSLCEALSTSEAIRFACTRPQPQHPKWRMVLASRSREFRFPPPLPIAEAAPECDARLEQTVRWAMENYGNGFRIPKVNIVTGAQAGVDAIKDTFEGRISFQKVVIEHPI